MWKKSIKIFWVDNLKSKNKKKRQKEISYENFDKNIFSQEKNIKCFNVENKNAKCTTYESDTVRGRFKTVSC